MLLHPEEIKRKLADRNLSAVARGIDVPYSTLYSWYTSEEPTKAPYYLIEKLSIYLDSEKE